MTGWLQTARSRIAGGEAVALVTVVAAEGSTPRDAGARMLVGDDRLSGTIGGGQLEFIATDQARKLLGQHERSWALQDYPLGPLLRQCCGGYVRLLLERLDQASLPWLGEFDARLAGHRPFELAARFEDRGLVRRVRPRTDGQWPGALSPFCLIGANDQPLPGRRPRPVTGDQLIERIDPRKPRLVIFGAGHVGQAVARLFAGLPFQVEQYDSRPEAAGPGVAIYGEDDLVEMAGLCGDEDFILILTHSHDLDYRLTHAVLDASQARYCGLIGSMSKRARFLSRLAEDGLEESAIARLTCPIGIPALKGKAPEVIAISVAAELLQLIQDGE